MSDISQIIGIIIAVMCLLFGIGFSLYWNKIAVNIIESIAAKICCVASTLTTALIIGWAIW
ncbi:MAG: hypothetical protein N3I35_06600 [Clostridia bacterium]|nr:hypothetical protein [Clostridia bacterium]